MGIMKFVEKFRDRPARTARELMGFPIKLEWKEVGPEQDDRIMADGRPAYAWWNEIQMLRAREPQIQKDEKEMNDRFMVLRLAEWAYAKEITSDDILLRIKRFPMMVSAKYPAIELLEHPEKYCSIEGTSQT